MAYDLGREDWRTFRVDRVTDPLATGARFTPRELPAGDAAQLLVRSMSRAQPELDLDVTFEAPADFVTARLPSHLVPTATGPTTCRLRTRSTDSVEWLAIRLALVDAPFTIQSPPPLLTYVEDLATRLTAATGS